MIQDDDFYVMLPSNANTNLFPTNTSIQEKTGSCTEARLRGPAAGKIKVTRLCYGGQS